MTQHKTSSPVFTLERKGRKENEGTEKLNSGHRLEKVSSFHSSQKRAVECQRISTTTSALI